MTAFDRSLLCCTISVESSLVFVFGAGVGPVNGLNCLGVTGCGIGPKPLWFKLLKRRRLRLLTCECGDPATTVCSLRFGRTTGLLTPGCPYIASRTTLLITPGGFLSGRSSRRRFIFVVRIFAYPGGETCRRSVKIQKVTIRWTQHI